MATSPGILAIDQGTTSSRAIVFDAQSSIIATAQQEFEQLFPEDGWVEHDPEAIWQTTLATAREALGEAQDRVLRPHRPRSDAIRHRPGENEFGPGRRHSECLDAAGVSDGPALDRQGFSRIGP